jgi:hypothetical protein
MAAKVIDIPAAEMVREWFDVLVENDEAGREDREAPEGAGREERLQAGDHLGAQFGGAGILVGANDGAKNAIEPLDLAKVKSVDWLTVVDSSELLPAAWYDKPSEAKYGQPEIYRLQPRFINMPSLVDAELASRAQREEGDLRAVRRASPTCTRAASCRSTA